MATAPQDPSAAGAPAAGADPASADAADDQGGYTICIEVAADGSITVGTENESDTANADGESDDENMQPAENIKDALTQALEIYKNNGQVASTKAADDFNAGFSGDDSGSSGSGSGASGGM